jgi:ABC-type branched-subunit amino acid transport system substrate-binding protein
MGEGAGVGLAVKGLRASYPQLAIVGTSSWPQQIYTDPAAANVVIAAFDPDGAGLIGERYNRFNRRALSVYAAYGYDSLAVVAGIVRGKGAAALTPDALTSKTGFRGVTGLFRFAKSGALERKIGLYKIEGGRLSAIEPKPAGF